MDAILAELGDVVEEHGLSECVTDKEVSLYTSLPPVRKADPLVWWRDNQATFPHLATLAKKYLCVPATSCSSERDFSCAGNIVTAKRNCLKPAKVNTLCFLSLNLKRMNRWRELGVSEE